MQPKTFVPFLAALALSASAALAQDAPTPPAQGPMMRMHHFDKADMEKFHARMCSDHYARAVGQMAYLETKLALTDVQKPLFNRWKNIRLAAAKSHSANCATMQRPGPDASIMEHVDRETAMLERRLADLKAERPALETLVKSLTPDQQNELKRAAMHARHERFAMMDRMHGDHGMMGGEGRRIVIMRQEGGEPPSPPVQ
jgi:LTXXQ motif family protein